MLRKKRKILITLNAFEMNIQLQGWGQIWPTGGHGPVGVSNHAGLWTVGSPYEFTRPILRC